MGLEGWIDRDCLRRESLLVGRPSLKKLGSTHLQTTLRLAPGGLMSVYFFVKSTCSIPVLPIDVCHPEI